MVKNVQRFSAAVVLAVALTITAAAGEISGPGATTVPPPPQQSVEMVDILMPGSTRTGDDLTSGMSVLDPFTEAALGLLQSVLSLF